MRAQRKGQHVHARSTAKLRSKVAEEIENICWQGAKMHDIDVREVLHENSTGITSYIRNIRGIQWASLVEVTVASQIKGLSVKEVVTDKPHYVGKEVPVGGHGYG